MTTSKIDDGGPAFPCPEAGGAHFNDYSAYMGLTLRDYFAAKALLGFLANPQQDYAPMVQSSMASVVADSWGIADAMIAARKEAS